MVFDRAPFLVGVLLMASALFLLLCCLRCGCFNRTVRYESETIESGTDALELGPE